MISVAFVGARARWHEGLSRSNDVLQGHPAGAKGPARKVRESPCCDRRSPCQGHRVHRDAASLKLKVSGALQIAYETSHRVHRDAASLKLPTRPVDAVALLPCHRVHRDAASLKRHHHRVHVGRQILGSPRPPRRGIIEAIVRLSHAIRPQVTASTATRHH